MINPHDPDITHEAAITEYLLQNGSITREQAFELCGCEDLKGTISDMREKGWEIQTRRITLTSYELVAPPKVKATK
ncbi:MAG: hypothetical protein J6M53_00290 [Bacteroidaceae bacterium]|nr:hypothetical protein [Bacteroidaceae bacterium]